MPETTNEELCQRIQSGDRFAGESLYLQNKGYLYRLAEQCVERYDCAAVKDDLIQVGTLALLDAAQRFDPARGTKLLTYATIFLRAAMVRQAKAWRKQEHSLLNADLPDTDRLSPEQHFLRRATWERLHRTINSTLSLDERDIVIALYGLGNREEREVDEVARVMMMRPDSVRKAHKRALNKLQSALSQTDIWQSSLAVIRQARRDCALANSDCGPWEHPLDVWWEYID